MYSVYFLFIVRYKCPIKQNIVNSFSYVSFVHILSDVFNIFRINLSYDSIICNDVFDELFDDIFDDIFDDVVDDNDNVFDELFDDVFDNNDNVFDNNDNVFDNVFDDNDNVFDELFDNDEFLGSVF